MSGKVKRHDRLETRLGYRFADPDLLDRALTHSSAVSPGKRIERSYQRLEFLGDRVPFEFSMISEGSIRLAVYGGCIIVILFS